MVVPVSSKNLSLEIKMGMGMRWSYHKVRSIINR